MVMDHVAVGRRIGDLRKERGWSHATLGEKAGVHKNTVINVELARNRPSTTVLESLATALGIDFTDLITTVSPRRSKRRTARGA